MLVRPPYFNVDGMADLYNIEQTLPGIGFLGINESFTESTVDLAEMTVGAAEVIGGDQDNAVCCDQVPFRIEKNGTVWPYVRVYTDVSGTIATGINVSADRTK